SLTVSLAVGIVAINREKRRTQQALDSEASARNRTRQALDEMSSHVIENLLSRQSEKLAPAQQEFLEKVLRHYRDFAKESGDSESVRSGVANAHWRVGSIFYRLGQYPEAHDAYRRAVQLYEGLIADSPGVIQYQRELARTRNDLGKLLMMLGRARDAETAYRA